MTNHILNHVETYGHGTTEKNDLAEDKKVVIHDHDGYADVYECESDAEAREIANWYLNACYSRYPGRVGLKTFNDPRVFYIVEEEE